MFQHALSDASDSEPAVAPLAQCTPCWSAGRLSAAAVILALLATLALALDLPVARYFRDNTLPGELRHFVRLAEVFGWGGSVAVIIAIAATLDLRGWRIVPRLAVASLGAGLAADGVKLLIVRLRPAAADLSTNAAQTFTAWGPLVSPAAIDASYGHSQQSFPSAHAATAAGLAIGLAALYPRGRWIFLALAILAGLQRLEAQAHFASDVLAGAALACLIGAGLSGWPTHRPAPVASDSAGP